MAHDESNQPTLPEQLTAYLDGELDETTGRQVEELIAADPKARDQMQELDQVWGLLNELPRSEADEQFARTTVEMLAIRVGEDLVQRRSAARPIWWLKRIGAGLALALAGFLGVVLVDKAVPRPDDALLRDLAVVENLDVYRNVDNIQYLRQLQEIGWLKDE